jgi:hypothetical protein
MVKKKDNDSRTTVLCRTCVNYYITYDTTAPYGCRALGFKSKKNPAAVVYQASGLHCQLYSPKKKKTSGGSGGGIVA